MKIEVRCPNCGRKLMEVDGKATVKCPKCKNLVDIDTQIGKVNIRVS